MASPPAAVVLEGLSKTFRIPHEQRHTLKERVLHPLRRTTHEHFVALAPLDLRVEQGEFVGIVGRNGSGKSTLLKCLAGIYRADTGKAWVTGRLSSFIELGVGFNMDLPARDNIRLNAVMLGLPMAAARSRADEIIAFAGLEGFEDLKIKNYSSGMLVRLGFSIMIHVDADVLLIDEVLAVGDAEFQQRCYEQFDRIRRTGKTVLFVTHDMAAVQRYCDRAVLIEHGRVRTEGDPEVVAQDYLRINMESRRAGPSLPRGRGLDADREGDGAAEILDAWFVDEEGRAVGALPQGRAASLHFIVRFDREIDHPVFGVTVGDGRFPTILSLSTAQQEEWTGTFRPGQEVAVRLFFHNVLDVGQYSVTPSVAHHGVTGGWLDRREAFLTLVVTNPRPTPGIVVPPHHFETHDQLPARPVHEVASP